MGTDVPMPDPYAVHELWGQNVDVYTERQMRAYAAACVAAELERWRKWACLKEWDNVNDPPCHPGDKDWRPCANCVGPNAPPTAAPQSTR